MLFRANQQQQQLASCFPCPVDHLHGHRLPAGSSTCYGQKNTDKWRAKYANYLPHTLQETRQQQQQQRQQQQHDEAVAATYFVVAATGENVSLSAVGLSVCRLSRVVYVAAAMNE